MRRVTLSQSSPALCGELRARACREAAQGQRGVQDLDHSCTYHDKLFFCDDERQFLRRAPWLVMRTDGYFVPALFLNPAHQDELDRMFPRKDSVFYLLAHYLFHPTNKV